MNFFCDWFAIMSHLGSKRSWMFPLCSTEYNAVDSHVRVSNKKGREAGMCQVSFPPMPVLGPEMGKWSRKMYKPGSERVKGLKY